MYYKFVMVEMALYNCDMVFHIFFTSILFTILFPNIKAIFYLPSCAEC